MTKSNSIRLNVSTQTFFKLEIFSFLFLLSIGLGASGVLASETTKALKKSGTRKDSDRTKLSVNVDCQHDFNVDSGNTQNCLSITKLKLSHRHGLGHKVFAKISLNPFAKVDDSADRYPLSSALPNSSTGKFGIVDSYAVAWVVRSNLELAIEEYSGGALIPDTSGLALGSEFDVSGWSQTAISATYHLPALEGIDVKFVLGNGEGENGENMDPQQYFGFELQAQLIKGVEFNIGASFDGNSIGSSRQEWLSSKFSKCDPPVVLNDVDTGYATKRLAGGAQLNGLMSAARGLKFGLGWQKVTFSDLNKNKNSVPTVTELAACNNLEIGEIFVEDINGETANSVIHSVFGINASYRVLDTYVLGFDYQSRTVETGVVDFFEPCESFVGESCQGRKTPQNTLSQSAITYGLTIELSPELALIAEYQTKEYDQPYNKFRYLTTNEDYGSKSEIVNGRISYRWK